ncbi:hypothetical protein niasHS_006697 [Heterodera schachtii]|uniref:Uncharacterized protein n=1 Tax=Heterodera schachtii TaxID=97005 RepID=A0ABD2JI05_HETSC
MSRPILDELTRALFAHLRGGNACFDEENELIELFRRCPRCSRSLRPIILDKFTDEKDGQQYERMWWTCPGIEQKECFFPLDIPKEVFWTRRSMDQSLRGILPLPNLHLLPLSLRALYHKLFKSNVNIEKIVRISAFVPSDGQKNAVQHANFGAEEQPKRQESAQIVQRSVGSVGPSLPSTFPPLSAFSVRHLPTPPNSVRSLNQCASLCDGFPSSSKRCDLRTVQSYLKETMHNRLCSTEKASVKRDGHRKSIDLTSNASTALNSHILLNGNNDPKWVVMVNSLDSLDPETRKKTSVPRYYSQQQHTRLQGMFRSATLSPNGRGELEKTAHDGRCPRYLFARPPLNGEETTKKKMKRVEEKPKGKEKQSKKEAKTDEKGKSKGNDELDVFAALDTLQKSLVTRDLMSRFCGQQRSLSVTPSAEEAIVSHLTKADKSVDNGYSLRGTNSFLPQSPSVGPRSTATPLTNSAGSSESDSSSLGRFRRGLSIGPTFPGISDSVEDPSLAEKITRNYESIFLKTLEQVNTTRRCSETPSASSPLQLRPPLSPQFVSHEALVAEEGTLGGIPHDFHFPSQPVPSFPPSVRPSNQLTPINYADGENLSTRFAHTQMEVTELSQQQQQMPGFALEEMTDYETYLGFGLEEEGDPANLHMTPMMPAGEAEDERDFLRNQLGMLP